MQSQLDMLILKFTWKNKHVRIARKTLEKKNYDRGLALPDIKIYYKVSIIENSVLLCTRR